MKKTLIMLFAFTLLAVSASAQTTLTDHWPTAEQCLDAQNAPFYFPSITRQQKLAKNEVIRGIPIGGCVELDLPDRMSSRGWVKIEVGRPFVYNTTNGELLRLAECNNDVYSFVPFNILKGLEGPQGLTGPPGPEGPRGRQGDPGLNLPPRDNGWCGMRNNTRCNVALAIVGIGIGVAAGHGGGGGNDKKGPDVTTKPKT